MRNFPRYLQLTRAKPWSHFETSVQLRRFRFTSITFFNNQGEKHVENVRDGYNSAQ